MLKYISSDSWILSIVYWLKNRKQDTDEERIKIIVQYSDVEKFKDLIAKHGKIEILSTGPRSDGERFDLKGKTEHMNLFVEEAKTFGNVHYGTPWDI